MNSESVNDRDGCAPAASTSLAREQYEAKRATVKRLREQLDKGHALEEDEDAVLLALSQPIGSTDPLSCLCCCKLKRLGHSYILHERWNGKLVIVGPHWVGVLVTLGIILMSTGMFLIQHVAIMPWYDTLVTLGLCGMTLYYLFQTTCTDPGIVRSKEEKETSMTEDESEVTKLEDEPLATVEHVVEMESERNLNQRRHPSRRRYCDICSIEQDRSMEHCEDCGVCIAGYDHHCPWMGKCIGRDNMHAFKMFNISWVLYVVFVLFIAIMSIDWGQAAVQTLKRTSSGEWIPVPTQNPSN